MSTKHSRAMALALAGMVSMTPIIWAGVDEAISGSVASGAGFAVAAGLFALLMAFIIVHEYRLHQRLEARVRKSPLLPTRVKELKSSWDGDDRPVFQLLLQCQDGSFVGGEGRFHRVRPKPEWVHRISRGLPLVVRWDEELDNAIVDWNASEEYQSATYRSPSP